MPGEGVQCARAGPPLAGPVPLQRYRPWLRGAQPFGAASHEGHGPGRHTCPWVGGGAVHGQMGHSN